VPCPALPRTHSLSGRSKHMFRWRYLIIAHLHLPKVYPLHAAIRPTPRRVHVHIRSLSWCAALHTLRPSLHSLPAMHASAFRGAPRADSTSCLSAALPSTCLLACVLSELSDFGRRRETAAGSQRRMSQRHIPCWGPRWGERDSAACGRGPRHLVHEPESSGEQFRMSVS
jgi:hypothetical protein